MDKMQASSRCVALHWAVTNHSMLCDARRVCVKSELLLGGGGCDGACLRIKFTGKLGQTGVHKHQRAFAAAAAAPAALRVASPAFLIDMYAVEHRSETCVCLCTLVEFVILC